VFWGIIHKRKASRVIAVTIGGLFVSLLAFAEDAVSPIYAEAKVHAPETAKTSLWSASVSAAFFGNYIWRGQLINDEPVFQPNATISYDGFAASLWGNLDLTDYNESGGEFTEYDWTLSYTGNLPWFDIVSYTAGLVYYEFPDSALNTIEVFGILGLNTVLNPAISIYRDVDEYDGTYLSFGLSHSIEKIFELASETAVGLTLSGSIGWGNNSYNKAYWSGLDENAFNDLTVIVSFPIAIGSWVISPCVNYVMLLDSDIRRADTYAVSDSTDDSEYFFAGLTISKGF